MRMKLVTIWAACLMSIPLAFHRAHAAVCNVNFDSNLGLIYEQAKTGIAYPTAVSGNTYVKCAPPLPNTDTGSCWMYRQSCVPGKFFTAFAQITSFYHLCFESTAINCFINGAAGTRVPPSTTCTPVNWAAEPRTLATDDNTGWLEIAQKNFSGAYSLFRLKTMEFGPAAVQLWYEAPDGSVWGWSRLAGNTNYSFEVDAKKVWVSVASGEPSYVHTDIIRFTAESY